jgi:hypothetical protein
VSWRIEGMGFAGIGASKDVSFDPSCGQSFKVCVAKLGAGQ